eukprot:Nitzschia sp. Nitz4//scaffold221_size33835//30023//30908//NITZ4_007857-RA/size33835-processed-gene-0.24-mRNA-1//-1//CDS//3329542575//701//frame0
MSQWEEDFPDDELMDPIPPKVEPSTEPAEAPKSDEVESPSEPKADEGPSPEETPSEPPKEEAPAPETSSEKPNFFKTLAKASKPIKKPAEKPVETTSPEKEEPPSQEEDAIPRGSARGKLQKYSEQLKTMGSNRDLLNASSNIVNEQESRLQQEIKQLLIDIRRIGTEGEPSVTFGELFDDEKVANYYEALVGTIKSAKKRGLISFEGQMLLKGPHDNVVITIVPK